MFSLRPLCKKEQVFGSRNCRKYCPIRAGPREVVYRGALEAECLKRAAQAVSRGRVCERGVERGWNPPLISYSITSILSKVRHSNPGGGGGGGTLILPVMFQVNQFVCTEVYHICILYKSKSR